jgi:hypothetical protein
MGGLVLGTTTVGVSSYYAARGIWWPAALGVISTTSAEIRHPSPWTQRYLVRFTADTYDLLAQEGAQGRGPYLDALTALLGCGGAARSRLTQAMQADYAAFFPARGGGAAGLLGRLERRIGADPALAGGCGRTSQGTSPQ